MAVTFPPRSKRPSVAEKLGVTPEQEFNMLIKIDGSWNMLLFRYFSVTREVLSSKLVCGVCVCSPGCKVC